VNLAEQLRQAILDSGLSLNRVSIESGVPYSALHGFVNSGRDLKLSNVERLAALFGMRLTKPTKRKAGRRGVAPPRRP